MRVCHDFTAKFDDPNLVSSAGLAPVLQLAQRTGLQDLVAEHVRVDKPGGRNAPLKVQALVAGMIVGADSIDDMALLRHGAMGRLFTRAGGVLASTFHAKAITGTIRAQLINVPPRSPAPLVRWCCPCLSTGRGKPPGRI